MTRGDALTWGLSITTDGRTWHVTYSGSQFPDRTFDTFDALIEWLEDEHEGYKISKMGKPK